MSFLGTIVNTAAVLVGSLIGLLIKKGLNERVEHAVMQVLGLSTIVIAAAGLITTMISVSPESGKLSSSGELILLVSLAIGALLGELLHIEEGLNHWGERIEKRFGASNFARGFISSSLLFCVGAMAIMGAFNDGLYGDSKILFIKSTLDFISSIVLTATLGFGVICSAVTVLVYQGLLTLGSGLLSGVLVGDLLNNICIVGYAIVACIGINFFGQIKIKTVNLLPALLVPVVYQLLIVVYNLL